MGAPRNIGGEDRRRRETAAKFIGRIGDRQNGQFANRFAFGRKSFLIILKKWSRVAPYTVGS
jgi:hypothetical protein